MLLYAIHVYAIKNKNRPTERRPFAVSHLIICRSRRLAMARHRLRPSILGVDGRFKELRGLVQSMWRFLTDRSISTQCDRLLVS